MCFLHSVHTTLKLNGPAVDCASQCNLSYLAWLDHSPLYTLEDVFHVDSTDNVYMCVMYQWRFLRRCSGTSR